MLLNLANGAACMPWVSLSTSPDGFVHGQESEQIAFDMLSCYWFIQGQTLLRCHAAGARPDAAGRLYLKLQV